MLARANEEHDFGALLGAELDDYLECRRVLLERTFEQNPYVRQPPQSYVLPIYRVWLQGQRVRPLTRSESYSALRDFENRAESLDSESVSYTARLLQRKLKLGLVSNRLFYE